KSRTSFYSFFQVILQVLFDSVLYSYILKGACMKKLKLFFIVFILSFISVNASTEALVDFSDESIEEIQEYVESGLLNYETITQIYLERIEKYNDDYKAIISINENVIEEAKALDKEFKEKGRRSLIHGIPVLVKDNIDVEG